MTKAGAFLEETQAIRELKRELRAADQAAGVALVEVRACTRNFEYHVGRVMELTRMLAVQMDRRGAGRAEGSSPAARRKP